jgi:pimeloyl-ACP methyl ester carboxylesterase
VYGLPIQAGNDAKVAYHSSRGDIINPARNTRETTRIAVVVVHGSGRNADDYFCSMQSAAELVATQRQGRDAGSILVIAPRFPIESDSDLDLINGGTALRWSDADANGPWRYGASAVYPPYVTQQGPFSSFEAMDHLVQALGNASTFPRLDRISIVGHSSGGQFVQRWSLLTPVWETMYINMRVVVMNPSSFAYLTPLRFINRKWRLPDQDCPNYNQWEWGFDPNANQSEYSIPYVQSVVNKLGIDRLTRRFALRTAVYLVGGQDVCNISSSGSSSSSSSFEWNSRFTRAANMASIVPSSPWCNSHGLETTCGDMLQGAHRVDRFRLYLDMLEQIAGLPRVLGAIVPGVGHDHSLMFHSNIGLRAIFGGTDQFGSTERWANGMSLLDH